MIATLTFSSVAALLVFLAGRGDRARDPRLTVPVLVLLAAFPLLLLVMPKVAVLPEGSAAAGGPGWLAQLPLLAASLWAGGFLLACARLAIAAWEISRWHRRSAMVESVEGVAIRELEGLRSPVAAGVLRPVVFVPPDWSRWPERARRIVLIHELAHHRRRDPLWRWIAGVACAVHWYNPLVHWVARRLSLQCEFACDARVLRSGVAADEYADLLCAIAEDCRQPGPVLAMAARSGLESRVRHLVEPAGPRRGFGIAVLFILAVAIAGALASMSPRDAVRPAVSPEEVETRWSANPFPGES